MKKKNEMLCALKGKILMSYKPKLVKKLRILKTISMSLLTVLALIYLAILIFDRELRSQVLSDKFFLCAFIITWLCLLIGFGSILTDFILMKRNKDIVRDLNDLALLDKLTGLPNRYSIDRISQKYDSKDKLLNLGCVLLVLDNIKEINEKSGRSGGDRMISDFCAILESVGTQYGLIGRNSGNEFLVVIEECDKSVMDLFFGDLSKRIHNHNVISPEYEISVKYSYVLSMDLNVDHFYSLIAGVYKAYESGSLSLES